MTISRRAATSEGTPMVLDISTNPDALVVEAALPGERA